MATGKRRSIHTTPTYFGASSLNFRPNATTQEDRGGTRPTGEPHSISFVMLSLVLHICKKILLFDTQKKIGIYCAIVFFGSVMADLLPIPKSYFSQSQNILNLCFIKWGWAWLLITSGPWVAMIAHTVGCGRRSYLLKHLGRLVVATLAWIIWMRVFGYFERTFGRCMSRRKGSLLEDSSFKSRVMCLEAGLYWSGLDISGHTFMIIYTTLILSEEGSAFVGWERIRDTIMKERHTRTTENEISSSSLKNLSDGELEFLRVMHNKLSPYLRGLFIVMTLQLILWDVMLIATILYYHTIVEKVIALIPAILTWYITYRIWFRYPKAGLLSPGDGLFKYIEQKKDSFSSKWKRNISNRSQGPSFMGRPLRTGFDGNNVSDR